MTLRGARWAAALLLAACAHVEPPPGGPEDESPPRLLVTRPDSLAVEPGWRTPVVLVFDERVSERGVETAVTVSPRTSPPVVDHRGDEIRVSLRQGWQPGVVYQITVAPEIQDLFQNRLAVPIQFTFSTGPEIPDTRSSGEVFDAITGQPEVAARVEAIRQPDSLVYAVPTDSAGRFVLARIPEGDYLLRAYRDMNANRQLDAYEPRDSVPTPLRSGDTTRVELGILLPDSTPPAVVGASLRDRLLELRFDDYLEPGQRLAPARVRITSPGGSFLAVRRAAVGELPPEDAPPADTADTGRPRPVQNLVVELAEDAVVEPEVEYRIRVSEVRNLAGLAADADTTLAISVSTGRGRPPRPAPADTVPADTLPADNAPAARRGPGAAPRLAGLRHPNPLRPRTPDSR